MTEPPFTHIFQTNADLPPGTQWLSPFERAHLAGLRFPKRRADWLLGRWTAREALFKYLGERIHPSHLSIRAASDGAPEVFFQERPQPVILSISHSGGMAFCAISPSGQPMGCDLEVIEARSNTFIHDYFTPQEAKTISTLKEPDRARTATLHWSARESVLKALRCGLRRDTRTLSVESEMYTAPNWSGARVKDLETDLVYQGWWKTIDGFVATICAAT